MKNREFYREEIIELTKSSNTDLCEEFVKKYVFPHFEIEECDLEYCNCKACEILQMIWLEEEHKEPEVDWTKVEVDTPILVSSNERDWGKRHFAKFENGKVWAWTDGKTSWTQTDTFPWGYAKLAEKE